MGGGSLRDAGGLGKLQWTGERELAASLLATDVMWRRHRRCKAASMSVGCPVARTAFLGLTG
jgi:hypothetical protein